MKLKLAIIGQSGSVGVTLSEKIKQHPEFSDSVYDPGVNQWSKLAENSDEYTETLKNIGNNAEIIILSVSDEISQNIVGILKSLSSPAKIIDCSTAHRTNSEWAYGLPELPGQRQAIQSAQMVANPGCHASAVNLTLVPLKDLNISGISCHSNTGYSGGGQKMIKDYESGKGAPKAYSIGEDHKHIAEIIAHSGSTPFFQPFVTSSSQGILCSTILPDIDASLVLESYEFYKEEPFIHIKEGKSPSSLSIEQHNETNNVSLHVIPHSIGTQVIAILDNLGKGSAGTVIQNANIMLGINETTGL